MSNPTEQLIGELLEPRLTKGDRESALGQVSDYLRQARGMPTLASISRATRLSPGTVRNALRRLEKSRMVKRLRVKAGSKGRRAKEIGRRHIFRWREDMSKTEIEKAADQLLTEEELPTPEEGDWGYRGSRRWDRMAKEAFKDTAAARGIPITSGVVADFLGYTLSTELAWVRALLRDAKRGDRVAIDALDDLGVPTDMRSQSPHIVTLYLLNAKTYAEFADEATLYCSYEGLGEVP